MARVAAIGRQAIINPRTYVPQAADFPAPAALYVAADFTPATWADSSGHGLDLVQANAAKRFTSAVDAMGRTVARVDGSAEHHMAIAAPGNSYVAREYTVMAAVAVGASQPADTGAIWSNRSWGLGSAQELTFLGLLSDGRFAWYGNNTNPSAPLEMPHEALPIDDDLNIVCWWTRDNHRHIETNGVLVAGEDIASTATGTSGISTRILSSYVGGEFGGTQFGGDIHRVAIWPRRLSAFERHAVQYLWKQDLLMSVAPLPLLIFQGETFQATAPASYTLVAEIIALLDAAPAAPARRVVNHALQTRTAAQANTSARYVIDAGLQQFAPSTVVVCNNGLYSLVSTGSAVTSLAQMVAYESARRSAGCTVVMCTVLPSANIDEAQRLLLNTSIRSTFTNVIDFASDPDMGQTGQYTDMTYYEVDEIRVKNGPGTAKMAALASAVIKPLILS